jgi:uncharacterized protein (UPF0332 family)
VTSPYATEIAANLERAEQSIRAAQELTARGFYDFAASRAYYAAFYAATAALLGEGLDLSKHSGVIAAIHQRFIKTGKLSKDQGKELNWLFELRNVGDYGVTVHVSQPDAARAIQAADSFLQAIKSLMPDLQE